jgi:hypothetical protein
VKTMTKLQNRRDDSAPTWNVRIQSTADATGIVTAFLPLATSVEMLEHVSDYGCATWITVQDGTAMISTEIPVGIAACLHDAMQRRNIPVTWH